MTGIQKYIEHYIVFFKDEEKFEPQEVSHEGGKTLMQQLNTQDFVMINGTFFNKYEIRAIQPYQVDFETQKEIDRMLGEQEQKVQNRVKEFLKLDKKERTIGRMQNMIQKAKDELGIS